MRNLLKNIIQQVDCETKNQNIKHTVIVFLKNTVIFILIGILLNLITGKLLYNKIEYMIKTRKYFPALTIKDFYNQNKIDILFLGSSRGMNSFDCQIFDSILKLNSFNFSTSAQTPITSYFVLKEVLSFHKPQIVVLEISPEVLYQYNQIVNGGYIFDNIRYSLNKIEFFINGFSLEEKICFLLPTYRYRNNWGFLFRKILSENEKGDKKDNDIYINKGFTCSQIKIKEIQAGNWEFDTSFVNMRHINYINKIIEICNENRIKFIMVVTPYHKEIIKNFKNYQRFENFIKDNIKDKDYKYLDFNNTFESESNNELFKNANHLNCEGAKIFSIKLANILKN